MREREINYLLKDLQRAGVRKLRFISKNVATDQLGRKIVLFAYVPCEGARDQGDVSPNPIRPRTLSSDNI